MYFKLLGLVAVFLLFAVGNAEKNLHEDVWLTNKARSVLMNSVNAFTGKLVEAAFGNTKGSYTVCPIIIWSMLTKISDLSGGETKEQLEKFLNWKNTSINRLGLASLYERYHHFINMEVNTSQLIVIDKSVSLTNKYLDHLREIKIVNVDFTKTDEAYNIINKRAKEDSDNLISEIIPKGKFEKNFRMVIANGGFIKGIWAIPFHTETLKRPFTLLDGSKKNVAMMRAQGFFPIGYLNPDFSAKIIQVDYLWENYNTAVNNYLVIPEEHVGFDKVEKLLYNFDFSNFEIDEKASIDLLMPKFKLDTRKELKKPLNDMGVTKIWSERSDLSGFSKNTYVNEFFHKTKIVVEPSFNGKIKKYTGPVTSVVVDKPFFWITVSDHGVVILFSRITNPDY